MERSQIRQRLDPHAARDRVRQWWRGLGRPLSSLLQRGARRGGEAPAELQPEAPARGSAGISNRPVEEERRQQERLPPLGTARGESAPALEAKPGQHPAPRDPAPKKRRAKTPPPQE